MNGQNQGNYQKMNDLDRAKSLRIEAERSEHKERVRGRLRQLIAISRDTEYDKYLAQLLKDLESDKATPLQVERETERSYSLYRQRLAKGQVSRPEPQVSSNQQVSRPEPQMSSNRQVEKRMPVKKDYEFKIGAHVFSLVGAVFVLIAFVIFGFNFLTGIWQGLCLYVAALVLVLLSELLLRRKSIAFSNVITGIGIGGLYVANIINYLVLHTISGIVAMIVALVIALGTIWISRKKNSTSIRIISLLGCYICFFPIKGFETALSFLVVAIMLLVMNVVSIFMQNQSNQMGINIFHVILNVVFTVIITCIAWSDKIDAVYLMLYVVTSFIFINTLCLKCCRENHNDLFIVTCIGSGLCTLGLFFIGSFGPGLDDSDFKMLYVQILTKVLVLAVSVVAFLFWEKEDSRKWNHAYYPALLMISLTSVYNLEIMITTLSVFFVVKILSGNKVMQVLDCIVTAWTSFIGLMFVPFMNVGLERMEQNPILNGWICLLIFTVAILISIILIRPNNLYFYFEFMITGYMAFAIKELFSEWNIPNGWFIFAEVLMLFILFMTFNHLPRLKEKEQLPYNIISVCIMGLISVMACAENWMFSSGMMILGAAILIVVFRKRFQLEFKRKYLLLAGYLAFFSLMGDYGSPVVESILLMMIALSCVGIGFKKKDKVERICGLVLAVFVCVKLVLYDFREVETMYRVLVFLVVGVLALGISFIYILLEKNEDKQKVAGSITDTNHMNVNQ